MAAYLPEHKNDIFISYASVDNEPLIPGDKDTKWVTTLRKMLKTRIEQRLGRRDSSEIWMDLQGLQGNSDFSEDIQDAIRSSGLLVCIVTEGYLVSEWCRKELELFVESCGGDTTGRIFMIRRDDIPFTDERWPEAFRTQTGYPFFIKDEETGQVRTLAQPQPDPQEKEYFLQVERVRTDIAKKLKEMKDGVPGGAVTAASTVAAAGAATTPPPGAAASAPAGTGGGISNGQAADVVYVGETTPDMYEAREKVKRHLEQSGYQVLPAGVHSRVPGDFRKEVQQDMEKACAFVRLFGPYRSVSIPGLEGGYEGVEAEVARSLNKPVVCWRSRDLEEVPDPEYKEEVFGPNVVAMAIEEFKGYLEGNIKVFLAKGSVTGGGGDHYVLIRADPHDLELADTIAEILCEHDIGYDIVDEDISLKDVTDSDDFDGLMVLYGNSSADWVKDQVRECRRVALKKKNRAPRCAVYIGPPDGKAPLRTKPPKFDIISDHTGDLLDQFIEKIASKGQPA